MDAHTLASASARRGAMLALLAIVTAITLTAVLWSRDEPSATANAPLRAIEGMSALSQAKTRMATVPDLARRVAPATPGTVHRLLSNVGLSGFTLYAWRQPGSDSVCYVSTTAGGGCFAEFIGPFNISVTDYDRLGSGAPVTVSGPVRDDVVAIEVVVDGVKHYAVVENNAAFFEVPDSTALPSDIDRVTAKLRNGKTENVRL